MIQTDFSDKRQKKKKKKIFRLKKGPGLQYHDVPESGVEWIRIRLGSVCR